MATLHMLTKNVKHRRLLVASLLAVLVVLTQPGVAFAAQPPRIPAWHEGEIVHFTVVNENVEGANQPSAQVPIPLYAFGPPSNQPQFDVLSAAPGQPQYNPWWRVIFVVVLNGRDVTVDPFTSEEEILTAAAAGEVSLIDSGFVFLCQVLPGP